jgi:hypothetical protein
MIETISPAAQVAENAARAIADIEQELRDLQDKTEAWQSEMRDLLAERDPAEQRREMLAATMASAHAELQKVQLAEEISLGTGLEDKAHTATVAARERWQSHCSDLQEHKDTWRERGAFIKERLDDLQRELDGATQRSQTLRAKLPDLRSIYDQAHAEHGQEEQARLEAAFAEVAARREIVQQQILAELEKKEAALREQIAVRLKAWPALARETLAQHFNYQPSPWPQMVRHWLELAQLAGDYPQEVQQNVWAAFIGKGVPLWDLQRLGPRSHIEAMPESHRGGPLGVYIAMLNQLAQYLAHLEQAERAEQAVALLK